MTELAREVLIRHVCDCPQASEHPADEAGTEHVFRIDGVDFPWYISERGPIVRRTDCGYLIDVQIIAQDVEVTGLPIHDERGCEGTV